MARVVQILRMRHRFVAVLLLLAFAGCSSKKTDQQPPGQAPPQQQQNQQQQFQQQPQFVEQQQPGPDITSCYYRSENGEKSYAYKVACASSPRGGTTDGGEALLVKDTNSEVTVKLLQQMLAQQHATVAALQKQNALLQQQMEVQDALMKKLMAAGTSVMEHGGPE